MSSHLKAGDLDSEDSNSGDLKSAVRAICCFELFRAVASKRAAESVPVVAVCFATMCCTGFTSNGIWTCCSSIGSFLVPAIGAAGEAVMALARSEHHLLRKPIAPKIRTRRRRWRRHLGSQHQRPLRRVRPPKARRRVHELDLGIPSYVRIGSDIHDATKHDLTRFAIRNHNQLAWANTGRQSDHGALRKYDDGAGVFCKDLYPFRLARIRFDAARAPNPNRNLKDADRDRNRLQICL